VLSFEQLSDLRFELASFGGDWCELLFELLDDPRQCIDGRRCRSDQTYSSGFSLRSRIEYAANAKHIADRKDKTGSE
jgi:hypothetical protein